MTRIKTRTNPPAARAEIPLQFDIKSQIRRLLAALAIAVLSTGAIAHEIKHGSGTVTGSTCAEAKKLAHKTVNRSTTNYFYRGYEIISRSVNGCTFDADAIVNKYSADYYFESQLKKAHDPTYVKDNYHNHNN